MIKGSREEGESSGPGDELNGPCIGKGKRPIEYIQYESDSSSSSGPNRVVRRRGSEGCSRWAESWCDGLDHLPPTSASDVGVVGMLVGLSVKWMGLRPNGLGVGSGGWALSCWVGLGEED